MESMRKSERVHLVQKLLLLDPYLYTWLDAIPSFPRQMINHPYDKQLAHGHLTVVAHPSFLKVSSLFPLVAGNMLVGPRLLFEFGVVGHILYPCITPRTRSRRRRMV